MTYALFSFMVEQPTRTRFALNSNLKNFIAAPLLLLLKLYGHFLKGSCHKRQKPQAPTPQAPIRNRQTRKVANAKGQPQY